VSRRAPAPLRVAVDMDGVLADLRSALRRHEAALFGTTGSAGQRLSTGHRRRLWDRVRETENFWETLDEPAPGGVARLAALTDERRWEVIFLTTRPPTAGASVQVQTQRWLISHGFFCPSVYVVRRSRGVIAAALEIDVVVDDRSENCLDVISDSSAQAILNWPRTAAVPDIVLNRPRIDVVSSFAEALERLTVFDVSRHEPPPSRLSRLLQAIGA
jgi:hypothetical protein